MSSPEPGTLEARRALVALAAGLVFGLGLLVSGMADPVRVLGFLDIAGAWNPALAFVMGGAVVVALPAVALARRRGVTLLGEPVALPDRFGIDRRLAGGAILFGLGWGLTGICPGPAILLLTTLRPEALLFGLGLAAGTIAGNQLRPRERAPSGGTALASTPTTARE